SFARDLRNIGDYYSPSETKVITYDGYIPSENDLPILGSEKNPYLPGAPEDSQMLNRPTLAPEPLK
ncbi:MAG: hypothetical protein ACRC2T_00690, partial [Thermoguttaceae bacterium]